MSEHLVISVIKKALIVGFKISMPFLIVTMILGILVSIIQAVTHLNDQSLTFVPKLLVTGILGILLAPFIINQMIKFTNMLFDIISKITTG